ncbi:hypothetical protein H5410_013237 [Solanum commersonii]|uniref:Uncharacterized protein n=1 Tax=Solanum commersonii TaxID=4109 RepID=A0A9J6AUR8_SOLCO|nr:hypothetical protein H5410_013237 [Solanum commersonii]
MVQVRLGTRSERNESVSKRIDIGLERNDLIGSLISIGMNRIKIIKMEAHSVPSHYIEPGRTKMDWNETVILNYENMNILFSKYNSFEIKF